MFSFQVPLKKVHLFTVIQLACLIALWVIKSFSQTSIFFPLMVSSLFLLYKFLKWKFLCV